MGAFARDPRVRVVLLVLVLLLSVGLAWHLVGPAMHEGMQALGLCLAVLALVVGVGPVPRGGRAPLTPVPATEPSATASGWWLPPPVGRHPPDLGDVLRC